MALVSMRQLLDHAAENGYGVPAFNVNNLEQVQAIMAAASEVGAPVIMQASAGARKYAGEQFLRHLISAAVEAYPDVPVCMHQDHGQSPAVCQGAMRSGFTSVMMDGSLMSDGKTISTYEYNVDVTRRVVEMAHCIGVSVEGELGCLGSLETMRGDKEDGHGTDSKMTREQLLTDPDQAADFVKATQIDALAIAIGTSHGAYKFTRKPRAKSSRSTACVKFTNVSRTPTSSCTAPPRFRRNTSPKSANSAATCAKPTACPSKKFRRPSSTACARSTSTRTSVLP